MIILTDENITAVYLPGEVCITLVKRKDQARCSYACALLLASQCYSVRASYDGAWRQ